MILQLPLLQSILCAVKAGQRVALCLVVSTRGSAPQKPGSLMVLHENMKTEGTLGGGCVEAEVCKRAFAYLQEDSSALLDFVLDHDYGWDDGLICGGGMEIAVMPVHDTVPIADAVSQLENNLRAEIPVRVSHESRTLEYRYTVESEPTLLIAGAGHVGQALARLAVGCEFRTVVIDDRPDLMGPDRFSPQIETHVSDISRTLREYPIDANTYVVIVTRGHSHDEQALAAVIRSPAKYIGMIGSKRKIKTIFDDLIADGVPEELLERVHSPIGLKINSVTVPEIAVSITAELISVRRADYRKSIEGPVVVKETSR